ncbi:sodium- and chloride-dependent neutral and basic amino acid transporter B(0+) isoform X1 [Ceratitis capitata]|uniref:sodium- and chloride-dependent neutral and basic amino acid transporter B(0+) isoform X1 n=2 Tax=Ceratitis capitata TaxID=7213 RepID=UPI000329B959|nr:sodium- and chloride-dependent neutral and basic amino acid transporter B(0+) isoform X1 [Ceratitis capitata]
MIYESSYDSGRLPFKPDLTRGYWAKSSDFVFTGISLAFRLDIFSVVWMAFTYAGCAGVLPYIICLFLFVVPLFVMQSFMGQFSSSGFISSFRIAPLFKGIGYISLAVNLGVLTYYSVLAAVPLLYLFHSLRPTLPWSCEGLKDWSANVTENPVKHLCHMLTNDTTPNANFSWFVMHEIPSNLFLKTRFNNLELFEPNDEGFYISWEILLCTFLTWTIISSIFYKCRSIEKLGTVLRYLIFITLALLLITVIRFSLVPSNLTQAIYDFFIPNRFTLIQSFSCVSIFVISVFGAGWGTVISLASFNKFKSPITQNSWTICLGQMFVFLSFAFIVFVTDNYFDEIKEAYDEQNPNSYAFINKLWVLYLSTGSVLAEMSWPNLWCIIFYLMLILTALITMSICLLSTLQSIFDDFENYRTRKTEITFIVIGLLAICSLYTCSNQGVFLHVIFANDTVVTQTALNLLLFLVVLWVYGRVRFQRDLEFMLSERFSNCKIYMLRFVSPLCLIVMLLATFFVAFMYHNVGSWIVQIAALLFIVLPWLYVPGYMIYIMLQTTGTYKTRFKRCCRPMDWYPVELEDRQRYEQAMRNTDMTHQLNSLDEETAT